MDPKDNAAWNAWATTIAERAAAAKVAGLRSQMVDLGEGLFRLIRVAEGELRRLEDRSKTLETEVVGLRERTASLQGELRGRAQGTEVELPALPEASRAHRARQN